LLFGIPLRDVQAGAQVASPAPAATPTAAPQSIPLPEVAERVERLESTLRELEKELADTADDKALENQLKARDLAIQEEATEALAVLRAAPTSVELRELETVWLGHLRESREAQRQLKGRVEELQRRLKSLSDEAVEWEATLTEFQGGSGLEALNSRIKDELARIKVARNRAEVRLHSLLAMQYRVSQQEARVQDVMDRVRGERDQFRDRLLVRDSPPLWSPSARGYRTDIQAVVRSSFARELESAKAYLAANHSLVGYTMLIFAACLIGFFFLKSHTREWLSQGILAEDEAHLLQRPVECALLIALLTLLFFAKMPPLGIVNGAGLLFLIPLLRLRPQRGRRLSQLIVWTLLACYVLAQLDALSRSSPYLKRIISALGAIIVSSLFLYLAQRIRRGHYTNPHGMQSVLRAASYVVIAFLLFSLAANVLGYVALSQIVGEATLHSIYVAAVLYTAFCVIGLTFETILKTKRAQRIAAVRLRGDLIALWGVRLIGLATFASWCFVTLRLFSIEDSIAALVRNALQSQVKIGSLSFSLGSILTFVLFLWIGFIFASAARFLLREDILPHFKLTRGVPNVISTLTYYLLILAVFFMALAAGGVELNRFTLITGAFGVGVGFGLQNVVNNFVSGLILLFERPIRVGDGIEVGGIGGEVRRLGVRSCTLLTPQGAEVIVPNSELISNKVINWTLSDQRRRVELPIGVAYDTEPERVMKLLVQVAGEVKLVLPQPKPVALFLGFGDSALNFELRFWVVKENDAVAVRSDVALAVATALRNEGIEIPVPQRDLNLRNYSTSGPAGLQANGVGQGEVEPSEPILRHESARDSKDLQTQSQRATTGNQPPALPD
jgi:small-conductance mechanosensitive channel